VTAAVARRAIVAIVGSGDAVISPRVAECAAGLGRRVAAAGAHLLTGGGPGVMAAASRGFCSVPHLGLSLGILPARQPTDLYPNPWVELAIRTHLRGVDPRGPDSRNWINALSCDGMIALPGSAGTRSEVEMVLARHPPCPVAAAIEAGEDVGGLARRELASLGVLLLDTEEAIEAFIAAIVRR
jgi:uncharacterized protein (TIGR00725 family)